VPPAAWSTLRAKSAERAEIGCGSGRVRCSALLGGVQDGVLTILLVPFPFSRDERDSEPCAHLLPSLGLAGSAYGMEAKVEVDPECVHTMVLGTEKDLFSCRE
jgi:hypothetical protein